MQVKLYVILSTKKKVKEAIERGATAEQLARALNMSVDDVVSEYNVFREDELQDAPKPTKKLKETLKEIEIPKRAGKIDEVEVPDREKREVVLKKKEPEENPVEQYLANIIVPQRAGRFPEVEVPRRSGRFPEVPVDAQRVPEQALAPVTVPDRQPVPVPPRSEPALESQLAAAQMQAMQPQVPAEVSVPERQLKTIPDVTPTVDPVEQYLSGVVNRGQVAKVELGRLEVPEDPIEKYFAGREARQERDVRGAARAIAQGVTLGFGEEIEALATGRDVEEIRAEMEEFAKLSPRTALYGEIAGAIPTSFGIVSSLRALGVTSAAAAGGAEAGAYGIGVGEDVEDGLEKGLLRCWWPIVGRIFDSIFDLILDGE